MLRDRGLRPQPADLSGIVLVIGTLLVLKKTVGVRTKDIAAEVESAQA